MSRIVTENAHPRCSRVLLYILKFASGFEKHISDSSGQDLPKISGSFLDRDLGHIMTMIADLNIFCEVLVLNCNVASYLALIMNFEPSLLFFSILHAFSSTGSRPIHEPFILEHEFTPRLQKFQRTFIIHYHFPGRIQQTTDVTGTMCFSMSTMP